MASDETATYYDAGGIETLAIIEAKLTPEQFNGYLLGCVIKYAARLNHKGQPESDSRKLSIYADALREQLA